MQSNSIIHTSRTLALSLLFACIFALTAAAGQTVYIVKRGDTLSAIARDNNMSTAALAERNGLSRNYHVRVGQRLIIPNSTDSVTVSPDRETTYVVKRGDTLYDIAKANNLTVSELARYNEVSEQHLVIIGERLRIPVEGSTSSSMAASNTGSLPASIIRAIRNAPVASGRWKYIVIHHSGTDEGTVKGLDRYHREDRHMENGLAYHFVIGNGNGMGNGEVAVGNRWTKQLDGGHLASLEQNKIALGICLVGNFDKTAPTAAQMKSLNALVKTLMSRCNIPAGQVKTHQQINVISTRCPGAKFPVKSFLAGLK
jgi:LysM repeat protein